MTAPGSIQAMHEFLSSDLLCRSELEAEVRRLRDVVRTAGLAARESAHAAQIYGNRLHAADNYLTTVAGIPDDVRADLRALRRMS